MASDEVMRANEQAGEILRPGARALEDRSRKSQGQAKKAGTRMKPVTSKQSFLNGQWYGNRLMYIHIAKTLNLEDQMFRCEECGRFCPPKSYGYGPVEFWGEMDHEIERSKSGHYRPDNARWVCAGTGSCHEAKHGVPFPSFVTIDDVRGRV